MCRTVARYSRSCCRSRKHEGRKKKEDPEAGGW
jgi:hypothetical protein